MYYRNCPKCGEEISYSSRCAKIRAEKRNTNCLSCVAKRRIHSDDRNKKISEAMTGDKNPAKRPEVRKKMKKNSAHYWKGKTRSEETKQKMRKSNKGQVPWNKGIPRTEEEKKNISESKKGISRSEETKKRISENHSLYWVGKKRSEETIKKIRLTTLKNIKERCGQVIPNSNPKATLIIRAKAKELGITDLRDAETPGGEFQVCGYFVDGRSKEKNIVIEYYEKAHKYKKERDTRRKNEIIKELGCKFIVIEE